MTGLLILLGAGISAMALLVVRPKRFVGGIAFLVLGLGSIAAFCCIWWPWFSLLCLAGCIPFYRRRPQGGAMVVAVGLVLMATILFLFPSVRDQVYLSSRYPDTFTYVEEGVFYGKILGRTFLFDREKGDSYQSNLYEKWAVSSCLMQFPQTVEVVYAYLEEQQTTFLATSYEEYVQVMQPTVYIGIRLPYNVEDKFQFPLHCVVEVLSQ